ncbi:hypothetical protein CALCODRAFT_122565 [Calocera cornea HHB12733]|uniref:Uncharacterized protein n=1 Tax=Calocera cornea HHB12733 TaxID=1353952 RepID=A0A165CYZ0_9BASI|nr:hypothetical protein CALCODRAFT_122565 [Calocera cornea HHB12733]
MQLLAYCTLPFRYLHRWLWYPPRPTPDLSLELAPIAEGGNIPMALIAPRPMDGNIELYENPLSSRTEYRLLVSLSPGSYASTSGKSVLSLRTRRGSGGDVPLTALALYYMLRPSITLLPGHGAEYTLHCIPLPESGIPRYVVTGPLTRITVWNLAVERDPLGHALEWVVTVNGSRPKRWTYREATLNVEGFEADLNGMVTIVLTASY